MQWKGFRFTAGISHDLNSLLVVKPAFLTSNSVDQFVQSSVIVDPITRKWSGVFPKYLSVAREEKPIFARECASSNWNQIIGVGSLLWLIQGGSFSPLKASLADCKLLLLEDDFACPRNSIKGRARAGSIKGHEKWDVKHFSMRFQCVLFLIVLPLLHLLVCVFVPMIFQSDPFILLLAIHAVLTSLPVRFFFKKSYLPSVCLSLTFSVCFSLSSIVSRSVTLHQSASSFPSFFPLLWLRRMSGVFCTVKLRYTGPNSTGCPAVPVGSSRSRLFLFYFFLNFFQQYRICH